MSTCMSTSRSNYFDMSIWKKHADHSTTAYNCYLQSQTMKSFQSYYMLSDETISAHSACSWLLESGETYICLLPLLVDRGDNFCLRKFLSVKGDDICPLQSLANKREDDKLCSQMLLVGIEDDIWALLLLAVRGGDMRLQLISATNGGEVSSHLSFVFKGAKLCSQLLLGVTGEDDNLCSQLLLACIEDDIWASLSLASCSQRRWRALTVDISN